MCNDGTFDGDIEMIENNDMKVTEELLDFLEKSPTCFHVVANIRERLLAEGYTELFEGQKWELKQGKGYFAARNESSVIAFRMPKKRATGFMIAASHSDSPSFKIKENPEITSEGAYTRLNVEKYGGMLMHPWFDRPLSAAGRVIVREKDGVIATRLVNIDRDLMMIPSLAIHMDRKANEGHELNAQKELLPVLGDETADGKFMDMLAEAAGVSVEDILSHDLFLYVRGRGSVWGASGEYVSAGHIDDLQCVYGTMEGFIAAEGNESVIPVLAVFDNEEVGSGTKQGADSTFLSDVLERIGMAAGFTPEEQKTLTASSFMVSADNAHAVHPAYAEKADPVNRPKINKGIVVKYHAGQKYTTDAVSGALFEEICRKAGAPVQHFTNRSDMNGGSTLGNISNAHVSLNTVDIGLPQLAMHSCVETAGVHDTTALIKAMKVFFESCIEDLGHGRYITHMQ